MACSSHDPSVAEVWMYLDAPGEYLLRNGTPATEAMAEAAGHDVRKWKREKARLDARRAAREAVKARFRDELQTRLGEPPALPAPQQNVGNVDREASARRVLGIPAPEDFQRIDAPPSEPPQGPDDPRWAPILRR